MSTVKQYPLEFLLVRWVYGTRRARKIVARETKDFYFVYSNGIETKYKKCAEVVHGDRLNDPYWGTASSLSSEREDLYPLDSPVLAEINAENLLGDTKRAVDLKLKELIKLDDYEKLNKVKILINELLVI